MKSCGNLDNRSTKLFVMEMVFYAKGVKEGKQHFSIWTLCPSRHALCLDLIKCVFCHSSLMVIFLYNNYRIISVIFYVLL
jgi:hypothetical protein